MVNRSPHIFRIYFFSIVLLLFWSAPGSIFGQISLRLSPGFGLQTLNSYVKNNANADRRFRAYNFSTTPSFTLSLQVDINHNWMLYAGWSTYRSVISYKYGNSGPNHWTKLMPPSNSFPFGIQKTLGVHHWVRISKTNFLRPILKKISEPNGKDYLLLFRSRIVSGVSYDLIRSIPGNTATNQGTNASLFLGLALQFFSRNSDKLQLNLLYSKGIEEIAELQIDYYQNGKMYSGILGSKGSFFTVQLAYPLHLANLRRLSCPEIGLHP